MTDAAPSAEPLTPLRQLARAAASVGLLNVGSMAITFVIGVLLARHLGPSGYGVYAIAMMVTTFAGMITEFGLPALTLREFAAAQAQGRWGDARGLLHWADRFVLAISLVLVVAIAGGGRLIHVGDRSAFIATMLWAVLLIPIVALARLRGAALLSMGKAFAGQLPVLILRPGLFAVALAAAWLVAGVAPTPAGAMMLQVTAAACALVVVAVFYRRFRPRELGAAAPIIRWRNWLASSVPMGMTEGLRLLQGQVALLVLGILGTTAQAGLYRVADSAMAVCLVVTNVLGLTTAPTFSRLYVRRDMGELSKVLRTTAGAMMAGTFLLGLPVVLVGEWAFGSAFGAKFAPAAHVFTVLWFGALCSSATGSINTYANMTGGERVVTIGTAAAVMVNVLVSLLLVPHLGEIGAAIGTAAGLITWNIVVLVRMKRRDRIAMTVAGLRPHHLRRALALLRQQGGRMRTHGA